MDAPHAANAQTYPKLGHRFVFRSYGVVVRLESDSAETLDDAVRASTKALLGNIETLPPDSLSDQVFGFVRHDDGTATLYRNGEEFSTGDYGRGFYFFYDGIIRIAVGQFSPLFVFVHAGVVGRNGKAVVIPGSSFRGKTTLVKALVELGCEYYSDEYALIDESGLVHPFARELSIRTDPPNVREDPMSVESFGGRIGTEPIPVGAVLVTEYSDGPCWEPAYLSPGEGVMELIPHTLCMQTYPERSLNVLKLAISGALLAKSYRGDAQKCARIILDFIDNTTV